MSRGAKGRRKKGGGLPLANRIAIFTGLSAFTGYCLLAILSTKGTDPKVLFLLGALFSVCVGGLGWKEGSAIAHTFTRFALAVGKLARGDFSVRFGGANFREAGRMSRQLDELTANLRGGVVEEKLAQIREKEARLLGRIRERMMPDAFPAPTGWEAEGVFLPGKRGGGDFLEYVKTEKRIYLLVGSAEGAGAAAGMVMVLGRTLLREWLSRGDEPKQVLEALNRHFKDHLVEGACLALTLVEIDPAAGGKVLVWGVGLRAPLYFYGRGELGVIPLEGIAVGLDSGPVFSRSLAPKRVDLARGQRLMLVTQGFCANLSPGGEEFGEERLEDAMERHGPKNTTVFVDMVAGEVEDFLEGEEPDEDVVLLSVKNAG